MYLKGKVINKSAGFIVVNVNDIGHQVFLAQRFLETVNIGQTVEVQTHQYVREDSLCLYGFKTIEELELFELLLSISGIGPKSALGVLSIAAVGDIKNFIARGDSSMLTKVSGIGLKTAQRVILELKEKISKLGYISGSGVGNIGGSDEIDALMALGYSLTQARDTLHEVDAKVKDSGERIKLALRKLGR